MRPSDLDPERWRRIDAVLGAALETPPDERSEFLTEACADDEDLRAEVEALLEAHARAGLTFDRLPLHEALASSEASRAEGRQVGPFLLRREIGRGGMGVVYRAEDTRLGREVALKVLPPWAGVGPGAKERFLSEARAIAALDHPNIATLYEADESEHGQLYMAFALYEGETLEARIRRGPLPVDEALRITARLAAGLEAAHRRGIIHRDVKPSNVLLTERGEVKLLDFGVAKVAGEEVTRDGARPGTVAYMSPEQAGGSSLDGRTDLWSLGVVLYEMLTGARPFTGVNPPALLQAILHDDPEPASSRRGDLPSDVERVVEKLLCRAPEGRYGRAAELVPDLEALAGGEAPAVAVREPPPAGGRERGEFARVAARIARSRSAGALLAVLVLLGGGAWLGIRAATGGSAGIERLAVLPLADLTGDEAHEHVVAGVHDALIAELGKVGSLDVISRTSVASYRGTQMSVSEIARELGVDALVEGSVSRHGDSLAVATALVEASPERQVWSASYRGPLGDVYEIGRAVARSVAAEIGIALSPAEQSRLAAGRPVDPEAYDAYALGQFQLEQRTREGFAQARRYFRQAIEIDSSFAPAYAGLAHALGSAAFFGMGRPSETMPRVRALGEAALRHDSALAAAHGVLAAVELYWKWDWEQAERHARRAIAVNPSDAGSWRLLSEALSSMGRHDEALAAVERGSELERLVPFSVFRPVAVLNRMRDFEEAVERSREGLEFFPDFWQGHWLLCEALAGQRLYDRAVEACGEAARLSDRLPISLSRLGHAYALAGRRADAERVVEELEARAEVAYVGGSSIAAVHGALGDRDRAFAWLDRAYEERDVALVYLADDAAFDPLRSDPRFDAMLEKVGLSRR